MIVKRRRKYWGLLAGAVLVLAVSAASNSGKNLKRAYADLNQRFLDDRISVQTSFGGHQRETRVGPTMMNSGLNNPLATETPTDRPYLLKRRGGVFETPKGDWLIEAPLTVNGDLRIQPGAQLSFAKDAYLIVKGALDVRGTEKEGITLAAAGQLWKGLYVLGGGKNVRLEHVSISGVSGVSDGILNLTAGVAFYRADVDLKNVMISGVVAEDGLNLIESQFEISNLTIEHTASDALDIDYSNGNLVASSFTDIGGDAIDFSGSVATVSNAFVRRVRDKAISIGEGSEVTVLGGRLQDVGVGIASKDGSTGVAHNVAIGPVTLDAAMTYVKKSFYSVPALVLEGCDVGPGQPFSRQNGTLLVVDGRPAVEEKVAVDELYQGEVMKK
jgi:hypothetical protein